MQVQDVVVSGPGSVDVGGKDVVGKRKASNVSGEVQQERVSSGNGDGQRIKDQESENATNVTSRKICVRANATVVGEVDVREGGLGRATDRIAIHDVKEAVEGKRDSSKKAGTCADADMKMDVNGGIESVQVADEVEEVCDGRWDDEVTIVQVRCGDKTKEGENEKESSGGKGKHVKMENIDKEIVDIGCMKA